jgi:glucose-6-phosphate isomerase
MGISAGIGGSAFGLPMICQSLKKDAVFSFGGRGVIDIIF